MKRLIVAPAAERDIDTILETSQARFGDEAAGRYRRLIAAAIGELLADPERGAVRRDARLYAASLYHLRHTARRLPGQGRVADARHFIVFRFDAAVLEVVRVLHDAMDLPRHLEGNEG